MPFPYFLVHAGVQYSGLIIIVWILELLPPKVNKSLWSERLKRLAQTTRVTTFLDQFLVCGMDTLFHASQKHPLKSLQCPRTHVVLIIPRRDKLILLACLVPRPQSQEESEMTRRWQEDGQNEGWKLRRVQWFLLALLFGVIKKEKRVLYCTGAGAKRSTHCRLLRTTYQVTNGDLHWVASQPTDVTSDLCFGAS